MGERELTPGQSWGAFDYVISAARGAPSWFRGAPSWFGEDAPQPHPMDQSPAAQTRRDMYPMLPSGEIANKKAYADKIASYEIPYENRVAANEWAGNRVRELGIGLAPAAPAPPAAPGPAAPVVDFRDRMLAEEQAREQAVIDDWISSISGIYSNERSEMENILGGPLDTSLMDENLALQLERLGFKSDAATAAVGTAYADAGVEAQLIAQQIVDSQTAEAARRESRLTASGNELAGLNAATAAQSSAELGANMGIGGAASDASNAILANAGLAAADIRNQGNAQANSVLARAAMYGRDAADQSAAISNMALDREFDLSEAYRADVAAKDYDRKMRFEQAIVDSINAEAAAKSSAQSVAAELGLSESELEVLIRNEQFLKGQQEEGGGSSNPARASVIFDSPVKISYDSGGRLGASGEATAVELQPTSVRSAAAGFANEVSTAVVDGEEPTYAVENMIASMTAWLQGEVNSRTPDGAPGIVVSENDAIAMFLGPKAAIKVPANLVSALNAYEAMVNISSASPETESANASTGPRQPRSNVDVVDRAIQFLEANGAQTAPRQPRSNVSVVDRAIQLIEENEAQTAAAVVANNPGLPRSTG